MKDETTKAALVEEYINLQAKANQIQEQTSSVYGGMYKDNSAEYDNIDNYDEDGNFIGNDTENDEVVIVHTNIDTWSALKEQKKIFARMAEIEKILYARPSDNENKIEETAVQVEIDSAEDTTAKFDISRFSDDSTDSKIQIQAESDVEDDGSNEDDDDENALVFTASLDTTLDNPADDDDELMDPSFKYNIVTVENKGAYFAYYLNGKRISLKEACKHAWNAAHNWYEYGNDTALLVDDSVNWGYNVDFRVYLQKYPYNAVDLGRHQIPYINDKVSAIVIKRRIKATEQDAEKSRLEAYKQSDEYKLEQAEEKISKLRTYKIKTNLDYIQQKNKLIVKYFKWISEIEDEINYLGLEIDEFQKELEELEKEAKIYRDNIATQKAYAEINAAAANMADDGSNDDAEEEEIFYADFDAVNDDDDELSDELLIGIKLPEEFILKQTIAGLNEDITEKQNIVNQLMAEIAKLNNEKETVEADLARLKVNAEVCSTKQLGGENAVNENNAPDDNTPVKSADVNAKFEVGKKYIGYSGYTSPKTYFVEKRTDKFVTVREVHNGRLDKERKRYKVHKDSEGENFYNNYTTITYAKDVVK